MAYRYLVFAKRAALLGVCLMDIERSTSISESEMQTITYISFDKESTDGIDIVELSSAQITERETQKALGKMPAYSGGSINYTTTDAAWKTAMQAEYPDMFSPV